MIARPLGIVPQPDQPCTALAVNLVEEDSISLAAMLHGSQWQLREVETCQQALDAVWEGGVPVVLCERHMPDGRWTSLLASLRRRPAPPPLIAVSRLADEDLWVEVLSFGGFDVLVPPFDRNELFHVLFLAWIESNREAGRIPIGLEQRRPGAPNQPVEVTLRWRST